LVGKNEKKVATYNQGRSVNSGGKDRRGKVQHLLSERGKETKHEGKYCTKKRPKGLGRKEGGNFRFGGARRWVKKEKKKKK